MTPAIEKAIRETRDQIIDELWSWGCRSVDDHAVGTWTNTLVRTLAEAVRRETVEEIKADIYARLKRNMSDGPELVRLVFSLSDAYRDKCARLLKQERRRRRALLDKGKDPA